jgi:hypothetical protein
MINEYDISEWILNHKDGLKLKLLSLYRPAYHLFPPAMLSIYLQQYEEGALSIIRKEINNQFNLDPETLLSVITVKFVKSIAPELLTPNV